MTPFFAVTRSFQPGLTFDRLAAHLDPLERGVARPIEALLGQASTRPRLRGLVVVTCAEAGNPLAEEERGGHTPTTAFLARRLAPLVERGAVRLLVGRRWGLNRGSASALNDGIALGQRLWSDATHALCWSPEFGLGAGPRSPVDALLEALAHAPEAHLIGHAREGWQGAPRLRFAQNTCALWRLESLRRLGGFDARCDGREGDEVLAAGQRHPRAGMEDFHAYLRLCRGVGGRFEAAAWGLAGKEAPAPVALSRLDPPSLEAQRRKEARQEAVMQSYVGELFAGLDLAAVWAKIVARDAAPGPRSAGLSPAASA